MCLRLEEQAALCCLENGDTYVFLFVFVCEYDEYDRYSEHMIMTDTRSVLVVEYSVLVTMGSAWHTSAALIHMYLFHICMCVL